MPSSQSPYQRQLERLEEESVREARARAKAHDMHGGDHPAPTETPPPTIIAQFGEWAVTPFGVECLVYPYQIQWDSLLDEKTSDEFWLRAMARKSWVNLDDFANVLRHGRQIHRYLHLSE
ncbi:MAG: hypothetical protein KC496_03010 [Anaerolineae bacterium]|nr:hypothetical protein [Anaerolineae bacterium]